MYYSKSEIKKPDIKQLQPQGKCGDGFCGDLERKKESCLLDCGDTQAPIKPGNQQSSTTSVSDKKINGSPFGIADPYSSKTLSFIKELGTKTVRIAGTQDVIWELIKKN